MQNKPELKIDENGTRLWYLNGLLHRENGPAIIRNNGTKVWYINNKLHREDGPAILHNNGDKEWFINDIKYSFKEYCEKNLTYPTNKLLS